MPHLKKETDPLIGFRHKNPADRRKALQSAGLIDQDQVSLHTTTADLMTDALAGKVENAFGMSPTPLCLATNFVVNGRARPIAMATEERSVVAAASKGAKLCLPTGFQVGADKESTMIAQIMFSDVRDTEATSRVINQHLPQAASTAMDRANARARRVTMSRYTVSRIRDILVIDLYLNLGEAMGANIVSRVAEHVAEIMGPIVGTRRRAAICSNDRTGRRVLVNATWPVRLIGDDAARGILSLQRWAEKDRLRAVTHNKGIMNAVSAIALATGQDTRAIEAGAHAKAAEKGYAPLTRYRLDADAIYGQLCLPIAAGIIGGATSGPYSRLALSIMGVESAQDLTTLMGAAGLAQNFAALLSLTGEGIPEAHARLKQ